MKLTPSELREHASYLAAPADLDRQQALAMLADKIRERLRIPANRYFTFNPIDGEIRVDTTRDRPLPIKKLSKSDQ